MLDAVEKAEMRAMHKKKRDKKTPEEPGHGEHEESLGKNMKENPNHKNKTKGCTLCTLHHREYTYQETGRS